ncbi:hypothetical protein [Streptomyces sp. NPDC127066]|uniref:hypothetical protein n=1 Tax=Streptomyces sp. NPDC127066 TaxID=3347125 RepID=UPI00365130EE
MTHPRPPHERLAFVAHISRFVIAAVIVFRGHADIGDALVMLSSAVTEISDVDRRSGRPRGRDRGHLARCPRRRHRRRRGLDG